MNTMMQLLIGPAVTVVLLFSAPPVVLAGDGESESVPRINVDFPGGSIADYVATLRRANAANSVNIIVTPESQALPVPPVKLVSVSVDAAVRMLEGPYPLADDLRAEVRVEGYEIDEDSPERLFKVMAFDTTRPMRTAVWSVAEVISRGISGEEVLGAVEAILSVFPYKAGIKFHPPTGLLIIRGSEDQLDLVGDALDRLRDDVRGRADHLRDLENELGRIGLEMQEIRAQSRVAEKEIAVARAGLERTQRNIEEGVVPRETLAGAELEVVRSQARFEILQEKIRHLAARMERLQNELHEHGASKRE